ncbi:ArsR/SmtB family transcription factor [Amycolatopsis thailandensis]|uniref:ArsR/SmtB family transcription factor n=1 Tax=Amycolatopsis thailandensis TaxID=589330 RepID=UPI00362E74C8
MLGHSGRPRRRRPSAGRRLPGVPRARTRASAQTPGHPARPDPRRHPVRGGGLPSSGELADRLGISAAAVSRHTTVLRDAGLITSRRHRAVVLHNLTPVGSALLG